MSAHAEAMRRFFDAFGSGDLDAAHRLFAESAEIAVAGPPSVPWCGVWQGRDRIAEFFGMCTEGVSTEKFEISEVNESDDAAVATGTFAHRILSTGRTFESPFAIRITADEVGDILSYRSYEDSFAASRAWTAAPQSS